MADPAKYLEWDSRFFGRRIARANSSRLDAESVQSLVAWCAAEQIECLYLLADSDDVQTVRIAEENGFRFVDIRLTLERKSVDSSALAPSGPAIVRPSRASDIPELKAIASASHHDTRFYADGHFSDDLCDFFYETWIENSHNGYADQVLVAELKGLPVGYITCQLTEDSGEIGLLGVNAHAQGQGIGSLLIQEALRWFAEQNRHHVTVVTQGRNVRAQRAYQKNGFISKSVQLWYHRWR